MLNPTRPRRPSMPAARRVVLLALTLIAFVVAPASPVRGAVSATEAESMLLGWVNSARTERGLVPLVRWSELADIAGLRAGRMAQANTLNHTVGGSLSGQLAGERVQWYGYGETIGYTTATWTKDAAWSLFQMWKGSPPHWDLLMSDRMNYAGVGLGYRSSNGRTFGTVVLTESVDHTGARAWFTSASRSGDDIRWTWSGADRRLQTRTAGLRDFDVQYRVDGGTWRTLRNDSTSTALTLRDRGRGRTYSLRIRATDRRGNVGAWTNASRIWVP